MQQSSFKLIIILIITSINLKGQDNFFGGYIILKNHDTISGWVSYNKNNLNPKKILFRSYEGMHQNEYGPNDIIEFGVNEDRYKSAIAEVEIKSSSDEEKFSPGPKLIVDTVFLQVLIEGDKSLYSFNSPYIGDNFYIKVDSGVHILTYKKYYKVIESKKNVKENLRFLGQLRVYLDSMNNIEKRIKYVSYNKFSIKKVFLDYYENCPSNLLYVKNETFFDQLNYVKGYVIDKNGDTLSGWINKNWENHPKSLRFLANKAKVINMTPVDILEFGIKEEKYISALAEIETSSNEINDLQNNESLKVNLNNVFLKVIVQGDKPLLLYKHSNGNENFYTVSDSMLNFLVYKKYYKKTSNSNVIVENNKFKGQLILIMKDCETVKDLIPKVSYTLESLRHLFCTYNDCKPTI